jgi:hypothetical protein
MAFIAIVYRFFHRNRINESSIKYSKTPAV